MLHQFYEPHPALKSFVNNIMMEKVKVEACHNVHSFTVPPFPEQSIIFYVRDSCEVESISTRKKEKLSSSIVIGPQVDRHIIYPGHDHLMIKVGFQPGGLYRLLGIPMTELFTRGSFDCVDLLGAEMNEVNERLREADSFYAMKLVIESFLIKHINKLKQDLPIDRVLSSVINGRGLIKIDQLASAACLSTRQFERVFKQRIGLSPKHFSRIVRFAQAWIIKQQHPDISWLTIANECGYFDQMHLIRDFQEFAGDNPTSIEEELGESQAKFFNRLYC